MDLAQLVAILSQLAFVAAAWRLASALKVRVDDHETRIGVLEKVPA